MQTNVIVTSWWYLGPLIKFIYSGTWYNNDTESGGGMGDIVIGFRYTLQSTTFYYTDTGSVAASVAYAEDHTSLGFDCINRTSLGAGVNIT